MNIDAVHNLLIVALTRWFEANPAIAASDGYYTYKLDKRCLIDSFDVAVALELHGRNDCVVVEAGAGYGQLSLLLSALYSISTTPYEMADSRFAGCVALKQALGSVVDSCTPTHGAYPDTYRQVVGPVKTVLIGTNTINSHWRTLGVTEEDRWKSFMAGFNEAIIDVERTGVHRPPDSAELELAVSTCVGLGYTLSPVAVPGASGTSLYHFTRS